MTAEMTAECLADDEMAHGEGLLKERGEEESAEEEEEETVEEEGERVGGEAGEEEEEPVSAVEDRDNDATLPVFLRLSFSSNVFRQSWIASSHSCRSRSFAVTTVNVSVGVQMRNSFGLSGTGTTH